VNELALFVEPLDVAGQSLDLSLQEGDPLRRDIQGSSQPTPLQTGGECLSDLRVEDDREERDQDDENEDQLKEHKVKLGSDMTTRDAHSRFTRNRS